MRFGITVFGSRIAPRCAVADAMLIVTVHEGQVTAERRVTLEQRTWAEILSQVERYRVDTIVCGGVVRDEKVRLQSHGVRVVENVACTTDEVIAAITAGRLRPGLGFGNGDHDPEAWATGGDSGTDVSAIDCLTCHDRVCLDGEPCRFHEESSAPALTAREEEMLESGRDVSLEDERILCRLSELIYFCLEMDYRRVGLAYCVELTEATEILAGVLRRFFEVIPVCCKIGGVPFEEAGKGDVLERGSGGAVTCNPTAQAHALEHAACDIVVAVGLCMGVDCVFSRVSTIPVTTLFVKDKSLANNPIGAIYSDYYLREAVRSARTRIEESLQKRERYEGTAK
jgi:uncharacterized metal-binding protein/predicted Fe-Mo cluster-binding NifX family protein